MLPPYIPRDQPRVFWKRLRTPSLVDWGDGALQVVFAIWLPSRLAELASFRLKSRGNLAREDPAFFIYLIYLTSVSGLMYGITLIASDVSHQGADSRYHQDHLASLSVLFWGFIVWPTFMLAASNIAWSTFLLFVLRRVAKVTRDSLATQLARSLAPRLTASPAAMSDSGSDGKTSAPRTNVPASNDQLLSWFYCFDLVCGGSFPGLLILFISQFICLPVILHADASSALAVQYLSAIVANLHHAAAAVAFVYSVALGIAILPAPLCRGAELLFAPLALWLLIIAVLTLARVNLTQWALTILFGTFFN